MKRYLLPLIGFLLGSLSVFAGEADLIVPDIKQASPGNYTLLLVGLFISVIGVIFGFLEFSKIQKLEVHKKMADVGNTIF
jgi:K(+)-stimulated pyrophosphate-energized sodium pump